MDATHELSPAARVVERMLTEGFATGNTDIVDELCSPDLIEHQFGLAGTSQEAIDKVKRGIAEPHPAVRRAGVRDVHERGGGIPG